METNELQTKLILWLENAAQAIGDFAVKEIPPVIHEYLQWKFFEACYYAILPIIGLLISVYILRWGIKLLNSDKDYGELEIVNVVGGSTLTLAALIATISISIPNLKTAVQIKIAPKVYLIEQASDIIKGKK